MAAWLVLIPMLLLAPAAGAQRVTAGAPQTNPTSPSLEILFENAKRHDTDAVLRLKPEGERSSDRVWDIGYHVALYIASPEKYQREFVDHFPVDADGVMRILYEQIEVPKLTPRWLFSFEALGGIAQSGDLLAIERCLQGLVSSRAVVAESLCDSLQKTFANQPEKFQKAIQSVPGDGGEEVSACFSTWDADRLQRLQSTLSTLAAPQGAPPEQRTRIQELLGWIRAAQTSRQSRSPAESGIEGIVLIGPTRPSVRVGDETHNEAPFATKLQVVAVADEKVMIEMESGQDGKFRAALPPGEYLVRQAQVPGQRYPIAAEVNVQVTSGKFSFVTLHLDSGLR